MVRGLCSGGWAVPSPWQGKASSHTWACVPALRKDSDGQQNGWVATKVNEGAGEQVGEDAENPRVTGVVTGKPQSDRY